MQQRCRVVAGAFRGGDDVRGRAWRSGRPGLGRPRARGGEEEARRACRDTLAAFEPLQVVERAFHTSATTIENVCVDHRRLHVVVPQQLLNRPDVAASHQQVRGEGMTQRMATGPLVDPRRHDRRPHRPLHQRLVVVVLEVPARRAVEVAVPRRKHPLPRPGLPDARVLALQGIRHPHASPALAHLARVAEPMAIKVPL